MAYAAKISFVPRDNGNKTYVFDNVDYGLIPFSFHGDDSKENYFKSLDFREIISNGYIDYIAVLRLEEFIEFHNSHYKGNIRDQAVEQFILKGLNETRYNWVIIEIYEWESGLND